MLRSLNENEFDRYIDFAYELALDPTRSGYPTYTDGIKTKADFIEHSKRSLADERDGILLYERDGKVCGWIRYFTEPDEKYMQTDAFNIESGTRDALHEFIASRAKGSPASICILASPKRIPRPFPSLKRSALSGSRKAVTTRSIMKTTSFAPRMSTL